jgi:hypothetical protein
VGEERTRGNSAGDSGWVTTQVAAEGKVRVKFARNPWPRKTSRNLSATSPHRSSRQALGPRPFGSRLQLTEQAHSSLEEEARALREERDRLRAELEAKRSKGFWVRLFGG